MTNLSNKNQLLHYSVSPLIVILLATNRTTYGVLRVLKTFEYFTPLKTCKCLPGSLALSQINYCKVVFGQMPNYLIKQLQQIQNCATGNVLSKYVNAVDFVNLNCLPILEGIEYNISKLTHPLINNKNWPFYLPVEIATPKRILNVNNSGHVLIMMKNIHLKIKLKSFQQIAN